MERIKAIDEIRIIPEFIGEAGMEREVRIDPEVMTATLANEDLQVTSPFTIHYEVTRHLETLHVRVEVKGEVSTLCARCLSPMTHTVDLHLESDYMPAPPEVSAQVEAERLSAETGYFRNAILLGEYIISELVLSLPFIYLCTEQCRGLCAGCGANLNTGQCTCQANDDPRFQVLSEFKNKLRR
ncbi:MAG: DUF177 domain-containing protein [Deltaproteobacteria bacterium]|nr:DUF177 domain-containing protein [Deltaproteobacteria bacterium]